MKSIMSGGFDNYSGASEDLPAGPRAAKQPVVPQRAEESLPKPGTYESHFAYTLLEVTSCYFLAEYFLSSLEISYRRRLSDEKNIQLFLFGVVQKMTY
jgi:hypothetical protein